MTIPDRKTYQHEPYIKATDAIHSSSILQNKHYHSEYVELVSYTRWEQNVCLMFKKMSLNSMY